MVKIVGMRMSLVSGFMLQYCDCRDSRMRQTIVWYAVRCSLCSSISWNRLWQRFLYSKCDNTIAALDDASLSRNIDERINIRRVAHLLIMFDYSNDSVK